MLMRWKELLEVEESRAEGQAQVPFLSRLSKWSPFKCGRLIFETSIAPQKEKLRSKIDHFSVDFDKLAELKFCMSQYKLMLI